MDESTTSDIQSPNPDYTPNARQWLINIGTSFGIDWSAFPTDESRDMYLAMLFEYFDYYAKRGLDFAGAFFRAVDCVSREIEAIHKGNI